jgi:hypothetical protein
MGKSLRDPPLFARRWTNGVPERKALSPQHGRGTLTAREREVLDAVARG